MSRNHVRSQAFWLAAALGSCLGCSQSEATPEAGTVEPIAARTASVAEGTLLEGSLLLGDGLVVQNLTVWPVYSTASQEVGPFLTLAEAEARGAAEVREKGGRRFSEAQVNQLVVENRGDNPVLICAGTVLKGGKQDRQVARDHVIPARTVEPLEAFCIEQGRWAALREGRDTAGIFTSTGVVASKRVRASAQYARDQSRVWVNVARVNAYTGKLPSTSTFLATVEDEAQGSVELRGKLEEAVREHFDGLLEAEDPPVGFAYAINGEVLTMRSFATSSLLKRHFPMFRRTMCLEADIIQRRDVAQGKGAHVGGASAEVLVEMAKAIEQGKPLPTRESSIWRILSRSSDRGGKAALWVRHGLVPDAPWVELTTDWTAPLEYTPEVRARLESLAALGYTQ